MPLSIPAEDVVSLPLLAVATAGEEEGTEERNQQTKPRRITCARRSCESKNGGERAFGNRKATALISLCCRKILKRKEKKGVGLRAIPPSFCLSFVVTRTPVPSLRGEIGGNGGGLHAFLHPLLVKISWAC